MKIDGGKTFNNGSVSEQIAMEEYSNAAGGTVPLIGGGQQQAALPPIVMPTKKGGAATGKHHHKGVKGAASTNIAAFNSTKKQFPQLNKLNSNSHNNSGSNHPQHKKNSYVSPYSVKTISKPP